MTESQQLLAEFVRNGSEDAFTELVARYVDLVYSAALRLVEGDADRARDVAQTVFADLARIAPRLSPNSMLGGWLHRRACFVARTVMRGERRRQARERQAVEMSALENHPDAALAEIAPLLDEAINELGADDRDAILLRFFEQRSLRAVGEALGTSENVAQKRVARAVQELAELLKHRGFALPAAALANGLTAGAVKAAPAGLAIGLAKAALAGSGAAGSIAAASSKAVGLTQLKVAIVGILLFGGVITVFWLQHVAKARRANLTQALPTQFAEQAQDTGALSAVDPPRATKSNDEPAALVSQTVAEPAASAPVTEPVSMATTEVGARTATVSGAALVQRLYTQPGSRVRIEGTNIVNRRPWQAESAGVEGYLDIEPASATETNPGPVEARAEVFVPIHSIKSIDSNGRPYSDRIDAAWYGALKARDNPEAKVAFYLSALARRKAPAGNPAEHSFDAKGDLVMVGVTNRITMPIRILPLESERLKIWGTTAVSWTSEAVDPFSVSADVGVFSPDTRVTVKFEWLVGPTNTSPPAARPDAIVPLYLDLPAPRFKQPPRNIPLSAYVEPFPEMPRAPLLVPRGLTNLAREAQITSSDKNATARALAKIVDGNKDGTDESIVYLRKGTQWVQLDLGAASEIFAIALWHAHNSAKVYHDVVVQVADDPDFIHNVRTLFNNDQDNTSGRGVGRNLEYFETHEGKLIDAKGVQARYIRCYSKGSTESALNEYTEIEVYGRQH